jgi:hypothetical protein
MLAYVLWLQVSAVVEEFGVSVESLLIKFGKNVVGKLYESLRDAY